MPKTQESLNDYYGILMYNVAWLRKQHGLSKKNMAKLLHISVKSLERIEHREMPPKLSIRIVSHIQNHFGIHPKDIVSIRLGE